MSYDDVIDRVLDYLEQVDQRLARLEAYVRPRTVIKVNAATDEEFARVLAWANDDSHKPFVHHGETKIEVCTTANAPWVVFPWEETPHATVIDVRKGGT